MSPPRQQNSQPPVGAYASGAANGGGRVSRRKLPAPSTIADKVKAECQAKGERRRIAHTLSGTLMAELPAPPKESIADRIRRLAREADEEELAARAEIEAQERRERDLERLQSPSAVLRLAQRDWPRQCADVAAIANELGIGLGECWRRVIKAGVDCLRDCDGEAAA